MHLLKCHMVQERVRQRLEVLSLVDKLHGRTAHVVLYSVAGSRENVLSRQSLSRAVPTRALAAYNGALCSTSSLDECPEETEKAASLTVRVLEGRFRHL